MRSKKYQDIENRENGYNGKNPLKRLNYWFDSRKTWQKVLMILIAIVIAFLLAAYAAFQQYLGSITKTVKDDEVIRENELSCVDIDGYVNILLLGLDSRDMDKESLKSANTDAIIIVSMNEKTKDVNLVSVFRDTYLKMGDTETYEKINAAYVFGGAKMTIKSLNQAMDLNIKKYVLFNFKMVSDLVNAVGGITVNVKEREIEQLNHYTGETARYIGQKHAKRVKKPGKQKLEGVQAVAYGRIRKGVGDDFRRTSRMRTVIKKVTKKLKGKSLFEMKGIMELCLDDCKTNLSENDMVGLIQRVGKLSFDKTVGWPYTVNTGMLDGKSFVFPGGLADNTIRLHKEIFDQEDYEPSETLTQISDLIASQVGTSGTESKDLGKYQEEIEAEEKKKEAIRKKKAKLKAKREAAKKAREKAKKAAED